MAKSMWIIIISLLSSLAFAQLDETVALQFYDKCDAQLFSTKEANNCLEYTRGKMALYSHCMYGKMKHQSQRYCICKSTQVGNLVDLKCDSEVQ